MSVLTGSGLSSMSKLGSAVVVQCRKPRLRSQAVKLEFCRCVVVGHRRLLEGSCRSDTDDGGHSAV